ncbi:hypothetical protein FNH22_05890 [Fulvivirga sp. M361]|uniref:hypothetical protein n=1 Tax=Fulvivirga sp. M361 TaxID=2594266 RepID=UPI00117A85C4|nr:hypothetical protein [Fulvivirga sp. M361]TRX60580.1 hypothetical protein FNH22_05890 [Fulvivirga sp. M361]
MTIPIKAARSFFLFMVLLTHENSNSSIVSFERGNLPSELAKSVFLNVNSREHSIQIDTASVKAQWLEIQSIRESQIEALLTIEITISGYESNDFFTWYFDDGLTLLYGQSESQMEGTETYKSYYFDGEDHLIAVEFLSDYGDYLSEEVLFRGADGSSHLLKNETISTISERKITDHEKNIKMILNSHLKFARKQVEETEANDVENTTISENTERNIPNLNAVEIECTIDPALIPHIIKKK